jgi:flagellar operon protein
MADPFRVQLDRANGVPAGASQPTGSKTAAGGTSFADTLAEAQGVRFSNHAQKRLESRDIQLSEDNVTRLSDAIDKAEKRGGKNSLVMVDDLAFIVNVRDRMVVTALDAGHRGEGVFTQIDSVVFADPAQQAARPKIDQKG